MKELKLEKILPCILIVIIAALSIYYIKSIKCIWSDMDSGVIKSYEEGKNSTIITLNMKHDFRRYIIIDEDTLFEDDELRESIESKKTGIKITVYYEYEIWNHAGGNESENYAKYISRIKTE